MADASGGAAATGLEQSIARLLTVGTWLAVALMSVGVLVLLATGRSPLEGGPPLDVVRLGEDVTALRPEGFLWLGLLTVMATPAARVTASLVGYVRGSERTMALVSAAILAVIALSIGLGIGTEG